MKRALSATVAAVAMVALLVPLAAPAKKTPRTRTCRSRSTPTVQQWPRTVTITGRLSGNDKAGKTIELQSNPHPFSGEFKAVATTTTDQQRRLLVHHASGRADTTTAPCADLTPDETSGAVRVFVRMKITRRVSDRTPAAGETVTFSGRVGPAHEGLEVLMQRRRPTGTWKTMDSARLGAAAARRHVDLQQGLVMKRDGAWRARIRGDGNHRGAISRRVRIDVL